MCTTDAYGDLCRLVWVVHVYLVGFQPLPNLQSRLLNNWNYWNKAYAKYFLKHLIGRKSSWLQLLGLCHLRKKNHFWIWLRVNSCMANGTKLPFQVQPARSPLILTSTKTSDSAYFRRGKKWKKIVAWGCSLLHFLMKLFNRASSIKTTATTSKPLLWLSYYYFIFTLF